MLWKAGWLKANKPIGKVFFSGFLSLGHISGLRLDQAALRQTPP